MKSLSSTINVALVLCGLTLAAYADDGKIRVVESKEGFLFADGDAKVLFYQREPKSQKHKYRRANYIHPLYDLDGNVLTEDFPSDHLHHRGVFWAWHQVWVGDKKIGDPWVCEAFDWDVREAKVLKEGLGAALRVRVQWKSPQWTDAKDRQKPLVDETTIIRVHPAAADTRKIDFDIRLLALEPNLRIGGSEDAKGYGGFSTRIHCPEDLRFTAANGVIKPQRTAIAAGPWMDFTGTFGKDDKTSGITILCHPSLPAYPQRWILRQSRSMQNVAYPGREPVALSQDKPMALRYRLVLHRGKVSRATIAAWHRRYAETRLD